jgi:tetratricopeptide (TPR) repeat protein
MPFFSRRIPYDRKILLRDAELAVENRRWRRAVRSYGLILAAEPNNAEMHFRIASALARIGHHFEAWESFQIAAQSPEIAGSSAQSIALYKTATELMPRCAEAWRELSRALLRHQEPDAALRALHQGRRHFKSRRRRAEAIAILRDAQELDPWRSDVVLDLCRLLGRRKRSAEALFLLNELERRVEGHERSRALALAWRIDPTITQAWKWMMSAKKARRAESKGRGYGVRRRA